jgi:hypothetical protein
MMSSVQTCRWCECKPSDQHLDLLAREPSASAALRKRKRSIRASFNERVLKLEMVTHDATSLVLGPVGSFHS